MEKKILSLVASIVAIAMIIGISCSQAAEKKVFEGHTFPELPYAYDALTPYIDAKTMEIHYSKHHRAYYDNFMKAAESAGLLQTPMSEIFADINKYPEAIRNNGGGYYNHSLFWEIMTPEKTEIPAELKAAIERDFGSMDAFKKEFAGAATSRFGSGWAWISVDDKGKLFISSTPNQDNPLMNITEKRGTPILGLDVWEHAYYLNYQNRRADYINNFWNIVNWNTVEKLYKSALP